MRSDTIAISAMSHQLMGGRRRSAVNHVIDFGCAVRISSATLTTCTISPTAWTRTMWAPASTAAVTAAAVPQSRSGAGRPPSASRMKDLRDGPDEHRPIERRRQRREPCQHTITVVRPFGKPDAGIDDHALRSPRPRPPRPPGWPSVPPRLPPSDSAYTASAYIAFGRPRMCISTSATRTRRHVRELRLVP